MGVHLLTLNPSAPLQPGLSQYQQLCQPFGLHCLRSLSNGFIFRLFTLRGVRPANRETISSGLFCLHARRQLCDSSRVMERVRRVALSSPTQTLVSLPPPPFHDNFVGGWRWCRCQLF